MKQRRWTRNSPTTPGKYYRIIRKQPGEYCAIQSTVYVSQSGYLCYSEYNIKMEREERYLVILISKSGTFWLGPVEWWLKKTPEIPNYIIARMMLEEI